jgi:hypothetical protein
LNKAAEDGSVDTKDRWNADQPRSPDHTYLNEAMLVRTRDDARGARLNEIGVPDRTIGFDERLSRPQQNSLEVRRKNVEIVSGERPQYRVANLSPFELSPHVYRVVLRRNRLDRRTGRARRQVLLPSVEPESSRPKKSLVNTKLVTASRQLPLGCSSGMPASSLSAGANCN